MKLLKVKAKSLYKEEINTLISNLNNDIEEEILLINSQILKYLKEKTKKKIKEFISYMNDDWFDLLEYHSLKLPDVLLRIDENVQSYLKLINVINYVKNNTIKCFEKYVANVLKSESTIFSQIKRNYIPHLLPQSLCT